MPAQGGHVGRGALLGGARHRAGDKRGAACRGLAPTEVAPLPGPGPSEGPEAPAAENVEVELAGCWAPSSLSLVRPLRVARRPERLRGALHVHAEDLRV